MASTINAFDLLLGKGEQLPGPGKRSKAKKKKPSKQDDGALPLADVRATAVPVDPAAKSTKPAEQQQQQAQQLEVRVADACEILEKSARACASPSERLKIWREWIKQAGERTPGTIRYRDTDGAVLEFKQVVLRSDALELIAEACLAAPLDAAAESALGQLLATFLPRRADAAGLASTLGRLAALLAEDPRATDTSSAAERAVRGVVAALKQATGGADDDAGSMSSRASGDSALDAWLDRLSAVDWEIGKQQSSMAKVAASGGSAVSKQQLDIARQLVRLQSEKVDLLQMGPNASAPGAGSAATAAALQASTREVDALRGAIQRRLDEAQQWQQHGQAQKQGAGGKGGGGGGQAAAQSAQAAAHQVSLKREETALAQQAGDLAAQIRYLETQLATLRAQASDAELRRVALQQRMAAAGVPGFKGAQRGAAPQAPSRSAEHYRSEPAAAHALAQLLENSTRAPAADHPAAIAARADAGAERAPEAYVAQVAALLQLSAGALGEVPSKVEFYRQRLAQADKLASLAAASKNKDAAAKAAKNREEVNRLMGEALAGADAVQRAAQDALDSAQWRFGTLNRSAGAGGEAVAQLVAGMREVESLGAQVAAAHATVAGVALAPSQATLRAPALAAPPPAPAPAPQQGQLYPQQRAVAQQQQTQATLNGLGQGGAPAVAPPQARNVQPIGPPASAKQQQVPAAPVAHANGGGAAHQANGSAAVPAAPAPAPHKALATAAEVAATPPSGDGFKQVPKKNRRKA